MVNYNRQLDRTFAALVDPTRRAILARLEREGGASLSALAKPVATTRAAPAPGAPPCGSTGGRLGAAANALGAKGPGGGGGPAAGGAARVAGSRSPTSTSAPSLKAPSRPSPIRAGARRRPAAATRKAG